MTILGIDYEKCSNCKLCVSECYKRYKVDETEDKVYFEDVDNTCVSCGHCIAVCPSNAILYENMGEVYEFEGVGKLSTIIPFDSMYKFLRGHRSIRHYKKDPLPPEILKKVIDVMQYAPSGGNLRYEKFVVLSDREKIKKLSDAVMETLISDPGMKARYEKSFEIKKKHYESVVFFDAPHVIFVYSMLDMMLAGHNIGISVTYGRLAAESLGLGTCWNGMTQIAAEYNPKILEMAGIRGKNYAAFTIGYPDIKFRRAPPRERKPIKGLKVKL